MTASTARSTTSPSTSPCAHIATAADTRAQDRRLKAVGRWRLASLFDPVQARAHLELLREDYHLSHQALAELAGISPAVVLRVLNPHVTGAPQAITERTHRAVMASAFDLDLLGETQQVSSVGTIRRVHALCLQGWSLAYLARRRGVSRQAIRQMLERQVVEVRVARQVRDLYRELSERPGPSRLTRSMAEAAGWAGSEAWAEDSIDDPRAHPDQLVQDQKDIDEVLIERFLAGEPAELSWPEKAAAYQQASQLGLTAARIAELFMVTTRTVSRWRTHGFPSTRQEMHAA